MLPDAMKNYLSEISRVLQPGGRVYATYFLLNMNSFTKIATKTAKFNFIHPADGALCVDKKNPELAVAYYEPEIVAEFELRALDIACVRYGRWASPNSLVGGQDVVIAKKGTSWYPPQTAPIKNATACFDFRRLDSPLESGRDLVFTLKVPVVE